MLFKFINPWDKCGFKTGEIYETVDDGIQGVYKFKKDNTYYDIYFVKKYFVEYTYKEEFQDKLFDILE